MSNFNPSCIELELGLGFDNCWLPSTSSRPLPNDESIYIVRLVTSDIPGRRVYSFLKKLNIKLTVFFKIYMVYQSSLQNISICHVHLCVHKIIMMSDMSLVLYKILIRTKVGKGSGKQCTIWQKVPANRLFQILNKIKWKCIFPFFCHPENGVYCVNPSVTVADSMQDSLPSFCT